LLYKPCRNQQYYRLLLGNLTGTTLTCPFQGARFDITTGRKFSEPILTPSQAMEPLPQTLQKYLEHAWPISRLMIRQPMRPELMEIVLKLEYGRIRVLISGYDGVVRFI
jgi:hypothetical protein